MSFQERLKLGEVVPNLNLPSNRNGNVNLWDLRQRKNLVIFFYHGIYCAHCVAKLKELSEIYANAIGLETETLGISFDNLEKLRKYAKRLGIPFHLLSDEKSEATETFTYTDPENNVPVPSIFITDRFGVLRYQKIASEAHELPDGKEILSWLILIETECPECSHL